MVPEPKPRLPDRLTSTLNSAIDAIGQTPLVELSRITRGMEGRLLAKLEYLNPGFSKKDRIARQIIEDAEANGTLQPGQTVVELTSGNTGTGLAIMCAVKGYPFVAVMSKGNSEERARMMRALGAEVVLVDQDREARPGYVSGEDLNLVEQEATRIVAQRGAYRADQFHNPSNHRAHYLYTAPEIISQAGGNIDAFCDFAGSGGTFAGCAARFKEHDPSIQCFVVEPAGCATLSGQPVTDTCHQIQGGGYANARLEMIRPGDIDGYLQVTDAEAITAARRLAAEEGIFAGFSSGANVSAALKLLAGRTVVTVINDSGLKYLSTELWA